LSTTNLIKAKMEWKKVRERENPKGRRNKLVE